MPLRALYALVLEHDIKAGGCAGETVGLLQQKEFYQVFRRGSGGSAAKWGGERRGEPNEAIPPGPWGGRGSGKEAQVGFKGRKRRLSLRASEAFRKVRFPALRPYPARRFFLVRNRRRL